MATGLEMLPPFLVSPFRGVRFARFRDREQSCLRWMQTEGGRIGSRAGVCTENPQLPTRAHPHTAMQAPSQAEDIHTKQCSRCSLWRLSLVCGLAAGFTGSEHIVIDVVMCVCRRMEQVYWGHPTAGEPSQVNAHLLVL